MPAPIEKKHDLDPNYYPSNSVPNYEEDIPTPVNNLIPKATALTKGDNTRGDRGKDTKGDKGEDKHDGTQMEEDLGGCR